MATNKFDWASIGGYAEGQKPPPKKQNTFDWASVGGYPEGESNQSRRQSSQSQQSSPDEPGFLKSFGQDYLNYAGGALRGMGQGTGDLIASALNAPISGAEYLSGYKIPHVPHPNLLNEHPGSRAESAGQTLGNLTTGLGLPGGAAMKSVQLANKGYKALTGAEKLPLIVRIIAASGGGAAEGALGSEGNRTRGAEIGGILGPTLSLAVPAVANKIKELFTSHNLGKKEKELLQSILDFNAQKSKEKSLQTIAGHQYGSPNAEKLAMTLADKEAELKSSQAFQKNRIGEQKMLPGEQLIPEAEHGVKNVDQVLRQTLGEGEPNIQNLSKHITTAIEGEPVMRPHPKTGLEREVREGGLREEIGKKYDALEENLPEVKIPSHDVKAVEKELEQLTSKKSNLSDEEKDKLRGVLAESHPSNKTAIVSGKKFFRAYRSMRKLEGEQRSKAFGLDPEAHDQWVERANNTKDSYEKMENIINNHFPKDTIKKLHEINHEYSQRVAPLHENAMYQQMLKGNFFGDVIKNLSGEAKGNNILRQLIQKNPELSRMALGHNYAEKPENLLKPKAINEPYISAHPEISKLLGLQKQAQGQLERSKQMEQLHKHVGDIPKLSKEIETQRVMIKRLENEAKKTGLNKEQVAKKTYERDLAKAKLKTLTRQMVRYSLGGLAGSGMIYGTKKIFE